MTEVRRDLVDAIKRQIIADANVNMPEEERQERLYSAVMSALTPDEDGMPIDEQARYLAEASRLALLELDLLTRH